MPDAPYHDASHETVPHHADPEHDADRQGTHEHESMGGSYWRFAAMIATSTIIMYGLMFLNVWEASHVHWSQTRAWMAVIMGAAMAAVMLSFMRGMYRSRRANVAIYAGAAIAFVAALLIVRSQRTVDDVSYMRAMIPHHSIAILTSERAQISDPEVRKLAHEIIEAQRREIAEMEAHIARLESR